MKKAALHKPKTDNADQDRFNDAVKQNLDQMMGQTRNARRMEPLPENATMAQVVARLNEISERLQ